MLQVNFKKEILFLLAAFFRRKCVSTKPCDYLEGACISDEDCVPGLACGTLNGTKTCLDRDECAENSTICKDGKVCINLSKTFK